MQERAVGTALIALGPVLVAHSLFRGQQMCRMREKVSQIGNSGIDETQEGNFTVIVGGVQPTAKDKADFVPVVIDETVEGECIGIIGVSRPPKKPTRPSD